MMSIKAEQDGDWKTLEADGTFTTWVVANVKKSVHEAVPMNQVSGGENVSVET